MHNWCHAIGAAISGQKTGNSGNDGWIRTARRKSGARDRPGPGLWLGGAPLTPGGGPLYNERPWPGFFPAAVFFCELFL